MKGVDGVTRRWVYLHLFKAGQPTLNWLHPSFVTQQLLAGDLIQTIRELGAKIVRFDANSLLGTERIADNSTHAVSRFHPLSSVSTEYLAMWVRKLQGYSYEENSINTKTLCVDLFTLSSFIKVATRSDLGEATKFGPDLSYDLTILL